MPRGYIQKNSSLLILNNFFPQKAQNSLALWDTGSSWHPVRRPPSRPGKAPRKFSTACRSWQSPPLCSTRQGRKPSGYLGRTRLRGHPPGSTGHQPTSLKLESGWIRKGRTSPSSLPEPCLFLGVALLVSSMFSDLCCKGCHPKAVCPRQLTQWRQEPVLTLTSNNRQIQQQATFL